jgi:hypothetical protein
MSRNPSFAASAFRRFAPLLALLVSGALAAQNYPDQPIYTDSLQGVWADWSWASTRNFAATTPVHGGTHSASVTITGAWGALSLHSTAIDSSQYTSLSFWIHGGTGGQQLVAMATRGGASQAAVTLPVLTASWQHITLTMAALSVQNVGDFDGIQIQDGTGAAKPIFYVDDMSLLGAPIAPPTPVSVDVDRGADRHPVSPEIFGVSASPGDTFAMPWPVVRWGGNSTTRYNWQLDTHNTAMDWFFMNIPDGDGVNNTVDQFIDAVRANGGQPLITLSTIGWTPKARQKDWGFSVVKYGTQQWTEFTYTGGAAWAQADAGNGMNPAGTAPITGNLRSDTSIAAPPNFETGWMTHIASRVGTAGAGGVKYFALDNEPALWSSTHRDIHPTKLNDAEMWAYTTAYGAAAKTQDPNIKLFGPVEWGWCAYFWSDADGCGNNAGADYVANGPLLEWYLRSAKSWSQQNGKRLIDYLDLHYYPQNNGVSLTNDESSGTASMRLRSLKSLYDPTYTDESWINANMYMIPRMRDMIAKNYPGTKMAFTEYNFGGVNDSNDPPAARDNGITAALAQSEALAIFAREGLDIATRWVMPLTNTRVEDGFKLFMNYDGAGAKVAGDSVRAVSSNIDNVGAYAIRASGAGTPVYVLLFNKSTLSQSVNLTISGGLSGNLTLYRYDGTNRLGAGGTGVPGAGGVIPLTLPARSAWLGVGNLAACTLPTAVANLRIAKSGSNLILTWNVQSVTDYTVHETPWPAGDFRTATAPPQAGVSLTTPQGAGSRFFRVSARNSCGTGVEN